MYYLVFAHTADPDTDRPDFKFSQHRRDEAIAENRAFEIDYNGRTALQMYPPEEFRTDARNYMTAGTARSAWQTCQISILPNNQILRITTKQMTTVGSFKEDGIKN